MMSIYTPEYTKLNHFIYFFLAISCTHEHVHGGLNPCSAEYLRLFFDTQLNI